MIQESYRRMIISWKLCVGLYGVRNRMIRYFCIVCFFFLFFLVSLLFFLKKFIDDDDDCLDSGHGGQTRDLDGDEADGWDEGKFCYPLVTPGSNQ